MNKTKYFGIFEMRTSKKRMLFTKSLDGNNFFDERLIDGYREVDPKRSKLAAAAVKGINDLFIKEGDAVLYLGASHGYTPSFVSDIVGKKGVVFCLDFSPRVVRNLFFICEKRVNMIPLLADASKPETYVSRIPKLVDYVYQDIAQKRQVEIFIKNVDRFLKPKGYCFLAVKSRSMDVTKNPKVIFKEVENELLKYIKIVDKKDLAPFERDHCVFLCQKK